MLPVPSRPIQLSPDIMYSPTVYPAPAKCWAWKGMLGGTPGQGRRGCPAMDKQQSHVREQGRSHGCNTRKALHTGDAHAKCQQHGGKARVEAGTAEAGENEVGPSCHRPRGSGFHPVGKGAMPGNDQGLHLEKISSGHPRGLGWRKAGQGRAQGEGPGLRVFRELRRGDRPGVGGPRG